ncbi:hypothetical protein [Nocardioides sp.]|uniref:hypothetical protein n=1 Tax=Nocardioides sp. TaxID=35761 RepID=UPI00286DEED9|nr:hypothetical protein [Nocardioides sp.]
MTRILAVLFVLIVTVAGCAQDTSKASDPGPMQTSTSTLEPITPAGIAAVVQELLGADQVAGFSAGGEDDTVAVEVRFPGAAKDILVVAVQIEGDAPVTSCADLSDRMTGPGACEESADGTILASGVGEAFSDENLSGSTVMAQSVNPGTGRVVFALYETYGKRGVLDPAALSAIVSDERLAALTAPTTNEAGARLDVDPAR